MKKRTISSSIGLFLVLIVVAIAPSITSGIPIGQRAEIVTIQSPDESNSIPASALITPIPNSHISSDDFVSDPNMVVEYNVETGVEREYSIENDELQSEISALEPYLGVIQKEPLIRPSSMSGIEELERVYDTTVYPFSAVVKIISYLNETHVVVGSGALIDNNHVLTAGHVVYDYYTGWRQQVRIIPGKNGPTTSIVDEPYGRAYPTLMRSTAGWIQRGMSEHDWAVLTLDRDIGDETGWLGVLALPDGHENFTDRVYTAGYPAANKVGYYMYNNSGVGGYADEFNHHYTFYGEGGQSGSSVWTLREGDPYAISIFAYGPAPGFGTRITQEKFDLLSTWIYLDDTGNPQPDLEPATSNDIFNDLGKDRILIPLFTGIPIATKVFNYGNSTVEKATLAFYLSADDNVTTDDYQIGKTTLKDIGALGSVDVEKTLRVPFSVPAGFYKIGWIIDPENEIAESFEDNNVFVHVITLQVITSFLDVSIQLWFSLLIVAAVLIIAIPTVVTILVKRKRKLSK